jgi:hypothetical protein
MLTCSSQVDAWQDASLVPYTHGGFFKQRRHHERASLVPLHVMTTYQLGLVAMSTASGHQLARQSTAYPHALMTHRQRGADDRRCDKLLIHVCCAQRIDPGSITIQSRSNAAIVHTFVASRLAPPVLMICHRPPHIWWCTPKNC